ncbi:hypothetical protein M8C13_07550 [Crossiella sp. SN42]|uniref:hypothetical protein n=1 Tax=Crossiella sp. SN42 TaxID=2944808 RepID=UPI00207D3565|nr:hypothetical protein [Crossiella sp. SN42]MCO1575612.1 hypothetical protein [Crossiella sp. SN42]
MLQPPPPTPPKPDPAHECAHEVPSLELSFLNDAMRSAPTDDAPSDQDAVHGLLIPYTDGDPIRPVVLQNDGPGTLLDGLRPHLGEPVTAATCLATVDFVCNDDGHYLDEPTTFCNIRATLLRICLWRSTVTGQIAASDNDVALARDLLTAELSDLMLCGPVVVLGVVPETGAWCSISDDLIDRLKAAFVSAIPMLRRWRNTGHFAVTPDDLEWQP